MFTHNGPWNDHSRQSPTLRFLEQYFTKVDSLDLNSTPFSTFYSPFAEYHDSNGDIYSTGPHIWAMQKRLLTPFCQISREIIEVRVVNDGKGKETVYAEFLTRFRLRGDVKDVVAPMFFVFCIGEAEEDEEIDGLLIFEVRLFWDTGILGRYVTDKKRRAALR